MTRFKFFSILIVAAILLAPATAHARGPRFSFSLNVFDAFMPCYIAPPPRPVFVEYAPMPYYPAPIYVERETIVREYHYSCRCPHYQQQPRRPRRYYRY